MSGVLTDVSDAALVLRVARFDEAALAEIYRRHVGPMLALSRRVLNSASLAEETVQEIFLKLWHDPDRFDPERGSLRTFLLAQCHSRSVDVVRSESSRRGREERELRVAADAGVDVEDEIIDLVDGETVRAALRRLEDTQRTPILLAYFGGYTYREVAELTDIPEGTVKGRIRSGLRRLREELTTGVQEGHG